MIATVCGVGGILDILPSFYRQPNAAAPIYSSPASYWKRKRSKDSVGKKGIFAKKKETAKYSNENLCLHYEFLYSVACVLLVGILWLCLYLCLSASSQCVHLEKSYPSDKNKFMKRTRNRF